MAIRSILLHLDAGAGSVSRLTLAHGLADRFGAEVTVLFGSGADAPPPAFAYSAAAALRGAEAFNEGNDLARASLQAVHGERRGSWCDVRGTLIQALVAEAAYADLLILGARPSADDSGATLPGLVEAAIMQGGTPALVVPTPLHQESLGERVMIAWDGSIPAARAVRAALPLLHQAQRVDIVSWSAAPVHAPFSRLALADWLKRHGVESRTQQRAQSAHVGAALVATAKELASDLVVMGCYGHPPLRERVFGGATRSVLASLPVAVLMAH